MTCADTGWSWPEVGRLTLPRLEAIQAEFRRLPPARWLLARLAGWNPPAEDGFAAFYAETTGRPPP